MKNRYKNILVLLMAFVAVLSCKKDDPVAPGLSDILAGEKWNVVSVMHSQEGDLTSHYQGFAMTFSKDAGQADYDGKYSIDKASPIFQGSSGLWKLTEGSSGDKLDFDNGMVFVAQITETTLVLNFTSDLNGGKVDGLDGGYVFTLNR